MADHSASPYPVILSLEMHCNVDQQNKIAVMCRQTLHEFLEPAPKSVWEKKSPEDLKYRILLKGKTLQPFPAARKLQHVDQGQGHCEEASVYDIEESVSLAMSTMSDSASEDEHDEHLRIVDGDLCAGPSELGAELSWKERAEEESHFGSSIKGMMQRSSAHTAPPVGSRHGQQGHHRHHGCHCKQVEAASRRSHPRQPDSYSHEQEACTPAADLVRVLAEGHSGVPPPTSPPPPPPVSAGVEVPAAVSVEEALAVVRMEAPAAIDAKAPLVVDIKAAAVIEAFAESDAKDDDSDDMESRSHYPRRPSHSVSQYLSRRSSDEKAALEHRLPHLYLPHLPHLPHLPLHPHLGLHHSHEPKAAHGEHSHSGRSMQRVQHKLSHHVSCCHADAAARETSQTQLPHLQALDQHVHQQHAHHQHLLEKTHGVAGGAMDGPRAWAIVCQAMRSNERCAEGGAAALQTQMCVMTAVTTDNLKSRFYKRGTGTAPVRRRTKLVMFM